MNEIAFSDAFEDMNKSVELYLKGHKETQIATRLGIPRKQVLAHIDAYKEIVKNDEVVKERARESLHAADNTIDLVQTHNWGLVETADEKVVATVLKNISDIEFKRVEMLQKAGLLQDAELGDEIAATQEKQDILEGIIREVVGKCDKCKFEVARRLADYTKGETVVVV